MHGVPASAFLYRKVVPALAQRGLRGVAFDLPGLGLADRPEDYDYTWTGLGRFSAAAVDALGLDRFHLVIHDIGGPVGLEVAAAMPDRIRSLLILNTIIEVDTFKRPWMMEPFAKPGIGELWLRSMAGWNFPMLMAHAGIGDTAKVPRAEQAVYIDLLKRGDGGRAFLKVMRGFERTREKRDLYVGALEAANYPIRVLWERTTRRCGSNARARRRSARRESTGSTPSRASISSRKISRRPWPRIWLSWRPRQALVPAAR